MIRIDEVYNNTFWPYLKNNIPLTRMFFCDPPGCNLFSQNIGNSYSDNDKIASFTTDIKDIKSKLQDNPNNYGTYDKYRNKTVVFAERDNKIYLVIILSIDASKNIKELNLENVIIVDQSLMIPIL